MHWFQFLRREFENILYSLICIGLGGEFASVRYSLICIGIGICIGFGGDLQVFCISHLHWNLHWSRICIGLRFALEFALVSVLHWNLHQRLLFALDFLAPTFVNYNQASLCFDPLCFGFIFFVLDFV